MSVFIPTQNPWHMRSHPELKQFKRHSFHILSLITVSSYCDVSNDNDTSHRIRNDELWLWQNIVLFCRLDAITEGSRVNVGLLR